MRNFQYKSVNKKERKKERKKRKRPGGKADIVNKNVPRFTNTTNSDSSPICAI